MFPVEKRLWFHQKYQNKTRIPSPWMLYWTSCWMEGDRRKCNRVLHFPSSLHFCKLDKVMLSRNLLFLPSVHCQYRQWVLLETLLQSGVTPTNHWRQDSSVLGFQLRDESEFAEGWSYVKETEEFLMGLFCSVWLFWEKITWKNKFLKRSGLVIFAVFEQLKNNISERFFLLCLLPKSLFFRDSEWFQYVPFLVLPLKTKLPGKQQAPKWAEGSSRNEDGGR